MTLKIVNPANGVLIQEMEEDGPAVVSQKAQSAWSGFASWSQAPLPERVRCLTLFREYLVRDEERLAQTLTSEMGKPVSQSRNEVKGVLGRIDFFLANVENQLKTRALATAGNTRERISWEPLGVIANISAWNYPFFVGANVFVPALLTGNAVLYKPSEFATLTGLHIAELLHEAGVPRDVFVPVVGGGATGAAILRQKLSGVFFTGSYATGKRIAAEAAAQLIKVQLELGGKDPVYVTDDVDIQAAAEATADGAFYNTGQSCCAVERIYVHEKIFDQFQEAFTNCVRKFKVGDPKDAGTYIGPLTRPTQLDVLDEQVRDALAHGAKLLCGGQRRTGPGNYFEPTVLGSATHAMEVMREESFGPIIGLQKVQTDEEALALMNDTTYGLTAAVFAREEARAERILARVHAGSAYWNCCDRVSPALPWSGRGNSGLGLTLSTYGIDAFLQPKAWHLRAPA